MLTGLKTAALLPIHVGAVFTGAKSFADNPVLASPRLNRNGLHVARVRAADRMAAFRRRSLRRLAPERNADEIDRDGFTVVRNVLPPAEFEALRREVETTSFPTHETRTGNTLLRFISLPPSRQKSLPALRGLIEHPLFQGLLRYASTFDHHPLVSLNTVITNPDRGPNDQNTTFHSDTFHATGKAWYFVRDVEPEDGPFTFARGSHRLNEKRLEWEREQSVAAGAHRNKLNQIGSFRVTKKDMAAMGYDEIVSFAVPANTLVVADTHGFHARAVSKRPSVRLAVYGSVRANPFMPVTWFDPLAAIGLGRRKSEVGDFFREAEAKITGRPNYQPMVGLRLPAEPDRA